MIWRLLFSVALMFATSSVIAAEDDAIVETGEADAILLINVLEPELTHSHLGVTAFTNYENKLPNDWRLDSWAEQLVVTLLSDAGKRVAVIEAPEDRAEAIRNYKYAKTGWTKTRLEPGFAGWLKGEMEANEASSALIVRSMQRRFPPDLPVFYSGYGVMSMHGNAPKRAFLFASVSVVSIAGDTFELGQGVLLRDSDCRERFDPGEISIESYKDLAPEHIEPYRERIKALMERRVRQSLTSAGLLPGEVEKCVVENG
ncbi:MAG TPA: hypothetical protein PLF73_11710 [Luteimonas sp.]|nr:hypothetical protein [Luteimonas sp.]HRO27765.1 hypothetical protein [Luteimonas sp.]